MANPAYQPVFNANGTLQKSFCNQGTIAVAGQMNAPMQPLQRSPGDPYLANAQAANLAAPGSGYRTVDASDAQSLANEGRVVIVTAEGTGHISTVRPTGVEDDAPPSTAQGPLVANVGKTMGVAGVNNRWLKKDVPKLQYYTPTD